VRRRAGWNWTATPSRTSGTAPEEVVALDECGAILVRTPESGL